MKALTFKRYGKSPDIGLADIDRPTLRPIGTYKKLQLLRRNETRWQLVYERDGVQLYRIVPRSLS